MIDMLRYHHYAGALPDGLLEAMKLRNARNIRAANARAHYFKAIADSENFIANAFRDYPWEIGNKPLTTDEVARLLGFPIEMPRTRARRR